MNNHYSWSFFGRGGGPCAALAGLDCKKHKEQQWIPMGSLQDPVSPAGGLPSLAVRASAANTGKDGFPRIVKKFEYSKAPEKKTDRRPGCSLRDQPVFIETPRIPGFLHNLSQFFYRDSLSFFLRTPQGLSPRSRGIKSNVGVPDQIRLS